MAQLFHLPPGQGQFDREEKRAMQGWAVFKRQGLSTLGGERGESQGQNLSWAGQWLLQLTYI